MIQTVSAPVRSASAASALSSSRRSTVGVRAGALRDRLPHGFLEGFHDRQQPSFGALTVTGRFGEHGDHAPRVFQSGPNQAGIRGRAAADLDARILRSETLLKHVEQLEPDLVLHAPKCPRLGWDSRAVFGAWAIEKQSQLGCGSRL